MENFLTKGDLDLRKGGYLVNTKTNQPVTNTDFVNLQKRAEYLVTFASVTKGKNFKGVEAYSLQDAKKEVEKLLAKKSVVFVENKKEFSGELTSKLKEEALNFLNFKEESTKVDKVNEFLQEFLLLNEFEEFGLFFTNGVIKLNKIYTMEDVVNAVTETIEILK